ncbi:MAG: aminopeptidase YwaD [Ulvibacter sp.]|jgi:aminopeptidase YwaD
MKYFTLIIALFSFLSTFSQSDRELVLETVNKNVIEGHIYFLADDLLKGRETGSPENKIAASYLANTLRGYGVKPIPSTKSYFQEVLLQKVSPPSLFELAINGSPSENKVILEASAIDFKGDAVYLGYGLEDDYKGKDVDNKLVIIRGGSLEAKDARGAFGLRKTKMKLAKEAGAIAIVELIDAKSEMWAFIDHNFNADLLEVATEEEQSTDQGFVYIWLQDENGSQASSFESDKKTNVTLKMNSKSISPISSQNVIGIVEGTDPKLKNEYIIYSAHYDHVGIGTPDENGDTIYNGARDNAVGTTTVLSMAENLAKYPTKRSALFILFTGEEKGLLGSGYYVDHPVLPLNKMVYCFNSDNAGYNDTSIATIVGLERTTAAGNIKDAATAFGLTAIDDPAPEQGLFDRSDNVHFAKKGIPAPTYSLGFTSFDGDVTKYYHRPGDEAQTLDYDYLYKFFSSYVLAGRLIANDAVTPFWIKNDKYEEAGKKLYDK